MTNLNHYSHKIGVNYWHIEFATKYRYKMFGKFAQQHIADASIRKVAHKHKIKIYVLSVMPDHVHMRVSLPHGMTDSKAMMLLKGGSAYIFSKIILGVDYDCQKDISGAREDVLQLSDTTI